jgi:hypothetical protein
MEQAATLYASTSGIAKASYFGEHAVSVAIANLCLVRSHVARDCIDLMDRWLRVKNPKGATG